MKTPPALIPQLKKSMGKLQFALHMLMDRDKVPMKAGKKPAKLGEEELFSMQFADKLRELTRQWEESGGTYGLRAVWCHVANERQAGWFTMILLRAMGMLPGAPDYWFAWNGGSGMIELKSSTGELRDYQEYFRTWAQGTQVNFAVCRRMDVALVKLAEWGAYLPKP